MDSLHWWTLVVCADRRRVCALIVGGAASSLLAACGSASSPAPTVATNPLIKPRAGTADLTAVQATSELAVGRNRFAIGLIDKDNRAISSGTVRIEYFKVDGTVAEKRAEGDAVFRSVGGQARGVWVGSVDFDSAGPWGAAVTLSEPAESPKTARLTFSVRDRFSAPGYGEPAVRTASLTAADVAGDLARVCTHAPPCALHELSIDQALEAGGKPLVLAFATPAFCTSATCGPQLDAVLQLHQAYGGQADFVHVEIYQYPFDKQQPVQAVVDWKLPSEPWTFIMDRAGIVRDRFEGVAPAAELEPSLSAVL